MMHTLAELDAARLKIKQLEARAELSKRAAFLGGVLTAIGTTLLGLGIGHLLYSVLS